MAAAYRTNAADHWTDDTGTDQISALSGDLLIVAATVIANTDPAPTCTDDAGGTYTFITRARSNTNANETMVFVRTALIGATSTPTVHVVNSGGATASAIDVVAYTGMTRTGAAAIRQSAIQENGAAAATPSVTLSVAALTTNATIAIVGNNRNSTGITAPASWTARSDDGTTPPDVGVFTSTRDSGFTGTTVTWGSTSANPFGAIVIELDASAAGGGFSAALEPLGAHEDHIQRHRALAAWRQRALHLTNAFAQPTPPNFLSLQRPVHYPDRIERPTQRASQQLATSFAQPTPPNFLSSYRPGHYPDALPRPKPLPSHQLAVTSEPPKPERTLQLPDVEFVDTPGRARATHGHPQASFYPSPLVVTTVPTQVPASYPDRVPRPAFGATWQPFAPALAPAPERVLAIADTEFPDFVTRPRPLTAHQPFATGIPPLPERTAQLPDVEVVDFVRRAVPTHWHPSFASYPTPLVAAVVPAWTDTRYPDTAPRPAMHATRQPPSFALAPSPITTQFIPTWFDDQYPTAVTRLAVRAVDQTHDLSVPPKPERTSPLADASFPERVSRPTYWPANQLAATSEPPRPEQTLPATPADYPSVVRRPAMPAALQAYAPTEHLPLERTAPIAAAVYPDRIPRQFHTHGTQAWAPTQIAPPAFPSTTFPEVTRRPRQIRADWFADFTFAANRPAAPALTFGAYPAAVSRPLYPAHAQLAFTVFPGLQPAAAPSSAGNAVGRAHQTNALAHVEVLPSPARGEVTFVKGGVVVTTSIGRART